MVPLAHNHQNLDGLAKRKRKRCQQRLGATIGYSTSTALGMLLASASREGGRGGGDFRSGHPLLGAWS